MGTWAAGNFASDGALDYVGGLIDQLTNTINECFEEENADLDEGGESHLMPSVGIIKILSENCGAAPPKPAVVQKWQKKYLKIYDSQIDDLDPQADYKDDRRKIIVQTFDDLVKLSKEFWKE